MNACIYKSISSARNEHNEGVYFCLVHKEVGGFEQRRVISIVVHLAEAVRDRADLRDNSWHSPGILADNRSLIDKHAAQQEQVQWQNLMAVAKELLGEGMEYDSRNFRADDQPGADAAEFSNEDEASIGEKTNNQ